MKLRRPIRVWKYRGWCRICRCGRQEHQLVPCASGHGYDEPHWAANAAMAHLKVRHLVESPWDMAPGYGLERR